LVEGGGSVGRGGRGEVRGVAEADQGGGVGRVEQGGLLELAAPAGLTQSLTQDADKAHSIPNRLPHRINTPDRRINHHAIIAPQATDPPLVKVPGIDVIPAQHYPRAQRVNPRQA
jgi:hypothetical protein